MSNDYGDINNYEMGKEIGEGNFGKVRLAIFKPTGEEFAIKILNKVKIKKKMKNVMLRENEIITKLNHINIVFVYKIIETEEDYFIVMEYCKLGELFDYIVKKKRLSENEASVFFYQLINGVDYIHSMGIAHRDLKPENLLLTEDKVLKIIDFGLSHEFNEEEFLKTKCGSPSYAAPEIISMPQYDGFKIDIWCCGIILYAMLCGYLPFEGDSETESNNMQLFKNILECEPELPDFLSNISRHLICEILNPDPDERITLKKIKKHPFYLKGKKLCKIDYSAYEKEIKTRESFYKNNNEEKKRNINSIIEDKNSYLENHNDKNNSKNYNNIISTKEGNESKAGKNSIDIAKNNYNLTINDNNTSNNTNINGQFPITIDNNIEKNIKAKLNIFSLKAKNKQNNEFNTFKKKFYPINLHNYNQKKIDKINNKIDKILNTEANDNTHFRLPFIGLRDAETIFKCLLSTKLKPSLDNSNINYNNDKTLNIKGNEEDNNFRNIYKSPDRYGPQINSKINRNSKGFKLNSVSRSKKPNFIKFYKDPDQFLFENIKQKMENSNNISNNNNEVTSNIYKNQKMSEEKLKEKYNLNINSSRSNGNGNNITNTTNAINTYSPFSINNEKTINKRKKFNKYNYDYDYNFNYSPKKNIIIKDTYTDPKNTTHNINNMNNINNINNNNINTNQVKTIIPINIKHSDQAKNTSIKKYSRVDNKDNCKSPEIKTIYNNIKININIHSNSVDKNNKDKNQERNNDINYNKLKFNNCNTDIPKKKTEKKLYVSTEANKDTNNNEVYKSILISPKRDYVNYSVNSNKKNGISLEKNYNKNKYNFTKIIQDVKKGNIKSVQTNIVKKNKSYVDNHSSIENDDDPKIKSNIGHLKIINRIGANSIDKRKNKEYLLRNYLFNTNKFHRNNFNNIVGANNHFLPKLNDYTHNNLQTENNI